MIRRNDFKGEKECRGVWLETRVRIWSREVGLKMEGSRRLVIRRVFEGGEGDMRRGRAERSSERGVRVPLDSGLDFGDDGGETCESVMIPVAKVKERDFNGRQRTNE